MNEVCLIKSLEGNAMNEKIKENLEATFMNNMAKAYVVTQKETPNDDSLFLKITKSFLKQIDTEYFSKLANETNEHDLFKKFDEILEKEDEEKVEHHINLAYEKINLLNTFKEFVSLPHEILIGRMIMKIENIYGQAEFKKIQMRVLPNITYKTCCNYMNVSKILDYKGLEKYYSAGSTVLRKIVSVFEANPAKFTKDNVDNIAMAFDTISKNGETTAKDYERMTDYVAYYYGDFDSEVDKELYYDLFKTGYKITYGESRYMLKLYKSTVINENGDVEGIKGVDKLNGYIRNLLANELNREKARCLTEGRTYSSDKTKENTPVKKRTLGIAVQELLETSSEYIDNKTYIEDENLRKSIQQTIDKLTEVLNIQKPDEANQKNS